MTEYLEIVQNIVILIFSLVIHENAHARVAYYLGDPTSKNNERFSFNPIKHIHWLGLILPVILALMHIKPIGFAKPVMVDTRNFKHPRFYNILVALAGPISNLFLATIAIMIYTRLGSENTEGVLFSTSNFLISFFAINLMLCLFNLIPLPPCDGSRLYTSFIDQRSVKIHSFIEGAGFVLIICMLSNDRIFSYFLHFLGYIAELMEKL
ncbi:MAG: site-2 protease family protein [Rickettsiaceae bacterium]|jgi:Zn-dependent protease|nr:site-2 protease family protein [Rickettsiaceae bacterium]